MTKDEFTYRVQNGEKKLYTAALTITKNTEDASDAVSEAVAYTWEHLDSLRDEEKFDAWLLKITCTQAKIIKKRSHFYVSIDDVSESFVSTFDTDSIQFFDILTHAKLSADAVHILVLRFMYGYTLNEIAKMTDRPLPTVKTQYYRALKKLADAKGIR